jgi:hypothetical protein
MTIYHDDPEAYVEDVITATANLTFTPEVQAESHPGITWPASWQGDPAPTRTLRTMVGNQVEAGTLVRGVRLVNPDGRDFRLEDFYLA